MKSKTRSPDELLVELPLFLHELELLRLQLSNETGDWARRSFLANNASSLSRNVPSILARS
eukprot:6724857-Prymnesium_polylepis.1